MSLRLGLRHPPPSQRHVLQASNGSDAARVGPVGGGGAQDYIRTRGHRFTCIPTVIAGLSQVEPGAQKHRVLGQDGCMNKGPDCSFRTLGATSPKELSAGCPLLVRRESGVSDIQYSCGLAP